MVTYVEFQVLLIIISTLNVNMDNINYYKSHLLNYSFSKANIL
jgi:hypothetical protein